MMSSSLLVFETESLQSCGVWRCPVAKAVMRSRPAFSSATSHSLTTLPLIQVNVCFFPKYSMSTVYKNTECIRRKAFFFLCPHSLDLPNATMNTDGEDSAFFSTLACCSLVNFAWMTGSVTLWCVFATISESNANCRKMMVNDSKRMHTQLSG